MTDGVLIALIGAVSTVIGVILTNKSMLEKQAISIDKELAVYQARTNERIDELAREVREHNQVIRRVYSLEEKMNESERRLTNIEHRPS